jgi:hypothetical protein
MKPKQPNKNGTAPKKRLPKWKRHLDEYRADDLVKITFASEADIDAGTALVWGGRLTGVAFRLDPNSDSFIVPKACVPFFAEEGIRFTLHPAFKKTAS